METINHEVYVSLEVAKLLKELGFDWNTEFGQHIWDRCKCLENNRNFNSEKYLVSLPTLEVAQRWLREVKNFVLLIDITPSYYDGKPMGYKFVIHISCGKHICGDWKNTYEEAQEAGIKRALEIILEEKALEIILDEGE